MAASPTMLPPGHLSTQKSPVRSDLEWNKHRPSIQEMFCNQNMTQKQVVIMLHTERGFNVTSRQLERKLKDWGLRKNIPGAKMEKMIQIREKRAFMGKKTNFRHLKNKVNPSDLNRYRKRTGLDEVPVYGDSTPKTPSDISYSTIPASPSALTPQAMDPKTPISDGMVLMMQLPEQLPELTSFRYNGETISLKLEGQSPAPFTAPPTPVITFRSPQGTSGHSPVASAIHTVAITATNPVHQHAAPRIPDVISHHNFAMGATINDESWSIAVAGNILEEDIQLAPASDANPRKVRYKQKEEDELVSRLDNMCRTHADQHPAVLDATSRLAYIYSEQGRYKTAARLYLKVAKTWEIVVGELDVRTLHAWADFACILHAQDTGAAAEKLPRSVLTKATRTLQKSDHNLLYIKTNLAMCLYSTRRSEAEQMCREMIRHGRPALEADDLILLRSMYVLALSLSERGEYKEGLIVIRTFITAIELSKNVDPHKRLEYLGFLGMILVDSGNYAEAGKVFEEVLEDAKKLLGPEHSATLNTQGYICYYHRLMGEYGKVEILVRDLLPVYRKVHGHTHPNTLRLERELVSCLVVQTEYVEAEIIARRILSFVGQHASTDWRLHCEVLCDLGEACHGQGWSAEGLSFAEKALELSTYTYGLNHHWTKKRSIICSKIAREMPEQ